MTEGAASAGSKFGVLALDDCGGVNLTLPTQVSARVEIRTSLSFDVPDHWRRWLGEVQTKSLEEANLVIAVTVPSETPHVLDGETKELDTIVTAHFFALLLEAVPDYQDALMAFGGINDLEGRSVRQVRRVDMAFRHRFGKPLEIDPLVISRAGAVAEALLRLHRSTSFRRVRGGFRACVRAIQTAEPEGRLHQFVRAVDGLMKLPKGKGKKEFVRRGPTFARGTNLDLILEQLYDMRNAHEHLNDFHDALYAGSEASFQRLASLRSYQAEQMALACYRRLLSLPHLLARFEDEQKTDLFWDRSEAERATAWGQPIDLDQVEKEHDHRGSLLGWT